MEGKTTKTNPKKSSLKETEEINQSNSHDGIRSPEDAVTVEVSGRVEPEAVALLAAAVGAAVAVHVGLEPPWLPYCVP